MKNTKIEPNDNFDHDHRATQSSKSDFDTNFDTDELIGNQFNSSNNNSFENQEKMLGETSGGGIKCLRSKRAKKK